MNPSTKTKATRIKMLAKVLTFITTLFIYFGVMPQLFLFRTEKHGNIIDILWYAYFTLLSPVYIFGKLGETTLSLIAFFFYGLLLSYFTASKIATLTTTLKNLLKNLVKNKTQ